MKCPFCEFENRDGAKFCLECGGKLELACPECGKELPLLAKFCDQCGLHLAVDAETAETMREAESERKVVTVFFSDLSGYTRLSEKLDPEDLKEIMSRIFGEVAQVVAKYEGFVEKFIGDAVVAIFGTPKVHEDDPIRAIRAAKEVHELVGAMSSQLANRTGVSLSMHTGINTGLVVTGRVNLDEGIHGIAGETMNLASRLCTAAKEGEILVGPDTRRWAESHFIFEELGNVPLKGKAVPVQVHKVIATRERRSIALGQKGRRAELIGRRVEMSLFNEALDRLYQGKGMIIALCGDAGTGKSRLVEEFRATLDLETIQWFEGHAYAYSQNIPYFPLVDLLNRSWQIEEGDPVERVREKVESGIAELIDKKEDIIPYVGGLYSLSYPEVEGSSPEFWKSRLHEAIQAILGALTHRAPTIIYLEDLHWADPSSNDLLRSILSGINYPALFLLVYRPPFSLFTSHELSGFGEFYKEIRLQELSSSEAQDMLQSLLKTEDVPPELSKFIQERVEGNPFFLEEAVNSLIESGTLSRENEHWRLTRSIADSDVPSTIQGLISARLDRLENETKRVLQEASVIGRTFLYEILRRITEFGKHLETSVRWLEQIDLIRTRALQPDIEFIFKHALTQEVAYNSLLMRERQKIHEKIAQIMEQMFQARITEFCETLAFHFKQGRSSHKAIDYLMRSGEKSLKRYAVEESHQHFQEAFDLLSSKLSRTREEDRLLVELLIKWAFVFYYRGAFKELTDLLAKHERLAESLDDKAVTGLYHGWLGMTMWSRARFTESYNYLCRALKLGEQIQNDRVIGYACTWLAWTCTDLGLLGEAVSYGERAQEISRGPISDPYLYFKSLGGLGWAYWVKGERKKVFEAGKSLLEYGQRQSNIRSMVMGHYCIGHYHLLAGDLPSAIESYHRATKVSVDPWYYQFPQTMLGICYVMNDQIQEAEDTLKEVVDFSENFGAETAGVPASFFLGITSVAQGQLHRGFKMMEAGLLKQGSESKWRSAFAEYSVGKVYAQVAHGKRSVRLSTITKNIGSMLREVPFAGKKAEEHLNRAIEVASEIGAKGIHGVSLLEMGLLSKISGKRSQAREYITRAIQCLEQSDGVYYLKQARDALEDQT